MQTKTIKFRSKGHHLPVAILAMMFVGLGLVFEMLGEGCMWLSRGILLLFIPHTVEESK